VTEADLAFALLETPSQVDNVLTQATLTRSQCLEILRGILDRGPVPSVWRSSGFMS
jgi:hypothetical protein